MRVIMQAALQQLTFFFFLALFSVLFPSLECAQSYIVQRSQIPL